MCCADAPHLLRSPEIKTAQTVCYEVLREIMRSARQFDAKEFRIF
jgi:ribonuclease G